MSEQPLMPRNFPTTGFEIIDVAIKIEEETLPFYSPKRFYPVHIGDVFDGRYQVVAKLGYGASSTTWLCHDLTGRRFVTLKIHVNDMPSNRELQVNEYLKGVQEDHEGREVIRMIEDSFSLEGPNGTHEVFVLPPLGLSLRTLQDTKSNHTFEPILVRLTLQRVLCALNFLHGTANITHTDVHAGNLLIGLTDESVLADFEEAELTRPSARKMVDGTAIHVTQFTLQSLGPLYLCDLGEARIGDQHEGLAMPVQYRAPEILLGITWGHSVDMWSVAITAWDLLEPDSLFDVYDYEDREHHEAQHLAHMTALLGPPPSEFLQRSPRSSEYWDEDGTWKHVVPLPTRSSLKSLTTTSMTGEVQDHFIDFLQKTLCWLPEERLDSFEAFNHPWVSDMSLVFENQ